MTPRVAVTPLSIAIPLIGIGAGAAPQMPPSDRKRQPDAEAEQASSHRCAANRGFPEITPFRMSPGRAESKAGIGWAIQSSQHVTPLATSNQTLPFMGEKCLTARFGSALRNPSLLSSAFQNKSRLDARIASRPTLTHLGNQRLAPVPVIHPPRRKRFW